ncbi:helix-hairpin-helix domain-containing protein [Pantoea sp. 18069]|uniref:ComEA family DNA-binding protein n=1 Tax=Pantoea sp. 18069 TaxID=2681415 RepID=UPI00135B7899|nr:helix-hairpin-helix domain-containing protein [Pantoea sp. 18069]
MLKKILTISALLYAACAFAGVEANHATQSELDTVKGIGPALSQRIVSQRQKAAFVDWADLINRVHGIGNASAAKLSAEGLTVNGKNYQGGPALQGRIAPPGPALKAPPPASP